MTDLETAVVVIFVALIAVAAVLMPIIILFDKLSATSRKVRRNRKEINRLHMNQEIRRESERQRKHGARPLPPEAPRPDSREFEDD